jgi:signal peptidase I
MRTLLTALLVGVATFLFATSLDKTYKVKIQGFSMHPDLTAGTTIFFNKKTPFNQLQVGDVIIYDHPHFTYHICHRIVEKHQNYLIVKGDNNRFSDRYHVTPSAYIGKVIFYQLPQ